MEQNCLLCNEEKEFDSAVVLVNNETGKLITHPLPVCKDCRKTKPLWDIYKIAHNYLVRRKP